MRVLLILTILLSAGCLSSEAGVSEKVTELSGLVLQASYDSGLREARTTGKHVFLYFRSNTCPWCLKFEEEVLSKETVKGALKDNFVLVSLDIYAEDNQALLGKYRVQGTPTMVFLNSKGEAIYGVIGFLDEKKFLSVLDEVLKK